MKIDKKRRLENSNIAESAVASSSAESAMASSSTDSAADESDNSHASDTSMSFYIIFCKLSPNVC